jgi:hypothetical protein
LVLGSISAANSKGVLGRSFIFSLSLEAAMKSSANHSYKIPTNNEKVNEIDHFKFLKLITFIG